MTRPNSGAPLLRTTRSSRRSARIPVEISARMLRRRRVTDRVARWVVTLGGVTIVVVILGILAFILAEVLPLAKPASVTVLPPVAIAGAAPRAIVSDDYLEHVAVLEADGRMQVLRASDGAVVHDANLVGRPSSTGHDPESALLRCWHAPTRSMLGGLTKDGRVLLVDAQWAPSFEGSERRIVFRKAEPVVLELAEGDTAPAVAHGVLDGAGNAMAAGWFPDGRLAVIRRRLTVNEFTEEETASEERFEARFAAPLQHLLIDEQQRNVFACSGQELLWWKVADDRLAGPVRAFTGGPAITAFGTLKGDQALLVGDDEGSIAVWFPISRSGGTSTLERVRTFELSGEPIASIAPSFRDKGFLAADVAGKAGLYYSTSERTLWTGTVSERAPADVFLAPKGDGAFVAAGNSIVPLRIVNPHPEASFAGYFTETWYEGFDAPQHTWQSSSGSDDYEPKLGLVPILLGTLKGTFYSLLLAVPLAVLAAMFASQFMHPSLRRFVKPAVEIMASLPSVVLGFLVGLWLAPRLEKVLPGLLVMGIVLPGSVILAGVLWRKLPARLRGRLPPGAEVLAYMGALAVGAWCSLELSAPVEALVFGGDFRSWVYQDLGLAYDQRNAVVVSIGMGFAVIPIIFTISEEAFSNVPRGLTLGSLALGANRWQTVTRVVLPSASPGIFSAIMVGFGRAVGETMIVLMATGNTPITSWNPFNGFRTLSANIAVEIPEAPHGSTLYRTLFLAALLLFVLTFGVNTVAELVRHRLRRRYANL